MIKILLLSLLGAAAATALPYQSMAMMDDGSYQFFYETGEDAGNQMRSETRGSDGIVVGKYGYVDPTGEQRVVNYRAGDFGYVAKGDVSVPGAPEGQFPAEPEQGDVGTTNLEEHSDSTDQKKPEEGKHEEKKQEHDETKAVTHDDKEEEEEVDDVKPMKLQDPSENVPPEGFPVGFFTDQFHNLRRLPEPEKKAEDHEQDKKAKKEGSSEEPGKDDAAKKAGAFAHHHDPHFASFTHPGWTGPSSYFPGLHQPVYVYSYRQPQAHGYYYFY